VPSAQAPDSVPALSRQRYGLILAILLSAGTTYALSQTLILPALPRLAEDLDAGPAAVSWLITSYLLSAVVATPLVGKLGDLYGRGRVLLAVAAIFCAGSVLCAVSGVLALTIAGRVLQGVAGGVFPLAYGVIRDTFPPERVTTAVGALSVSLGLGSALGPAVAGFIVDHAGAAAVFWAGILGALPALAAPLVVRDVASRVPPRLDLLGAAGLGAALVCLMLAITRGPSWGLLSAAVLGLLALSAALFAAWVWIERSRPEPLVELRLLAARPVALSNLASIFVGAGSFTTFAAVPVFAQAPESTGYGFGLSVAAAGMLLVPHGLVMIVGAPLAGHLCHRIGTRATLLGGAAVNAAASALLVVAHGSPWWVVASMVLLGIGQSGTLAALPNLVVAAVSREDVGIATGMNMVTRTIGMALGAAGSAALLAASVPASGGLPAESGYVASFALAAISSLAAFACALAVPRLARTRAAEVAVPA
jgi:MFS family permease